MSAKEFIGPAQDELLLLDSHKDVITGRSISHNHHEIVVTQLISWIRWLYQHCEQHELKLLDCLKEPVKDCFTREPCILQTEQDCAIPMVNNWQAVLLNLGFAEEVLPATWSREKLSEYMFPSTHRSGEAQQPTHPTNEPS